MPEKIILTDSINETAKIFGELDCNLERLEEAFGVVIKAVDSTSDGHSAISVSAPELDAVENAANAIGYLKRMARLNESLTSQNVEYVIE